MVKLIGLGPVIAKWYVAEVGGKTPRKTDFLQKDFIERSLIGLGIFDGFLLWSLAFFSIIFETRFNHYICKLYGHSFQNLFLERSICMPGSDSASIWNQVRPIFGNFKPGAIPPDQSQDGTEQKW